MTPNAGFTNGWTEELNRLRAENALLHAEIEQMKRGYSGTAEIERLRAENARLKEENQRLSHIEWRRVGRPLPTMIDDHYGDKP